MSGSHPAAAPHAPVAIHWFRRDLRLADNPALTAAARHGRVLPVVIDDPDRPDEHAPGAAYAWWRHHSLAALDKALGGHLRVLRDDVARLLPALAARHGATLVTWSRAAEPWIAKRDEAIAAALQAEGIAVRTENGSLLWEPWEVAGPGGGCCRVFSAFHRRCRALAPPPRPPLPAPELAVLPRAPDEPRLPDRAEAAWERKLARHWTIGEEAAQARLRRFVAEKLRGYAKGRDYPSRAHGSRLSPHLAHGEISPHVIWHAVADAAPAADVAAFRAELVWREFAHHLLFHFPRMADEPLRPAFRTFAWRQDPDLLAAWQRGRTGIPLVDAGMRELWETGFMHNRVRMVAASFLVKNLLIDWRAGESWFRDCLVDFSFAANAFNWQWVADCGTDAAPYFRIFNPVTQARKFDPDGAYIRRFVPELAKLPARWIGSPWMAPGTVREAAGLRPARDYPAPIVDLAESRARALEAYRTGKGAP